MSLLLLFRPRGTAGPADPLPYRPLLGVGENAVILELNNANTETVDAYGDVTTAGATAWEGAQPAYLQRVRSRRLSGGQVSDDFRDRLVVRDPALDLTGAIPGDDTTGSTVLVEDMRTVPSVRRRFRVVAVDHRAIGSRVDSLRLELDDPADA